MTQHDKVTWGVGSALRLTQPTDIAGAMARTMRRAAQGVAAFVLCVRAATAQEACGEVVTISTHGRTTTAVSIAMPPASAPQEARMALVLLPGGPGYIALD